MGKPRRMLPASVKRPMPIDATGAVTLRDGVEILGSKPRLLVTVRLASNADKRDWRAALHRHGVTVIHQPQDAVPTASVTYPTLHDAVRGTVNVEWTLTASNEWAWSAIATFDVCGTPESLNSLCCYGIILRWQLVMSCSVGQVSSGTGDRKPFLRSNRTTDVLPFDPLPGMESEAKPDQGFGIGQSSPVLITREPLANVQWDTLDATDTFSAREWQTRYEPHHIYDGSWMTGNGYGI